MKLQKRPAFISQGVHIDLWKRPQPSGSHSQGFHGFVKGGSGNSLFGISPADRRRHVYIIGQTGSGKTTLLRNMIIQHIAAGHGVGLIDPNGDHL